MNRLLYRTARVAVWSFGPLLWAWLLFTVIQDRS